LQLQYAPSKFHPGIGRLEQSNDTLNRLADAFILRANLGPAYVHLARKYARLVLNLRRRRSRKENKASSTTRLSLAVVPGKELRKSRLHLTHDGDFDDSSCRRILNTTERA
jgi:hypothetical protein